MKAKNMFIFLFTFTTTLLIIVDSVSSSSLFTEDSKNSTQKSNIINPQDSQAHLLNRFQQLMNLNPLAFNSQNENFYSFKNDLLYLTKGLLDIIKDNSNKTLFADPAYKNCSAAITDDSIFNLFKNHFLGGRLMLDAGDESDCFSYNSAYSYYLLRFELNSEKLSKSPNQSILASLADKGTSNFLSFLQKNHTYLGFCFFSACNETLWKVFEDSENLEFKQKLMDNTGLNITNNKVEVWKFNPETTVYPRTDFKIFLGIMIFYIFVKFAMIIYSFSDVRIRQELIVMPYNISLLTESKRSEKAQKLQATELIKYFSLKHQMEILTNDLETYFNDKKIVFFHLIRLILLNMLNLYTSFLTFFVSPKMNLDSFYLMKKPTFNAIKLVYYASNTIYFVNGVFFTYKLLALVFKYKSFSAKSFLYFYLHVMIRFIPISLFFYMVYSYGNEFIFFFSSRPILSKATFDELYRSQESKILKDGDFLDYATFIFTYFYRSLIECKFPNRIQPYLQLVCFALNDFIIFSFSVLLFYLLFRFRNKYIDWVYFFSVFGLLVKIGFNYDTESLSKVTSDAEVTYYFNFYQLIYNLNSIVKIDHSYICYFIGNLIGILFFFHITVDPKIDDTLNNYFNKYIPFKFVLRISYFINNKFGQRKKKYMIALFILMNICSTLLTFNYNSTLVSHESLLLKVNGFTSFLVQYEIIIFTLIFAVKIFTAFFIFNLTQVYGKKFILLISRSYYIFIPMCYIFNYYIFVFFQIDMDTYFSNILFFSLATFLLIYLCALVFLLLFEIPLRILFKRKTKRWFNFSSEKTTNF